jgi:ABC-type bacteriocin/lantibiotic exporter with double-glycine peptidase domain
MLSTFHIISILRESLLKFKLSPETPTFEQLERNNIIYQDDQFDEFQRDLVEAGNKAKLLFMKYTVAPEHIDQFLYGKVLVVSFKRLEGRLIPVLFEKKNNKVASSFFQEEYREADPDALPWLLNDKGEIVLFAVIPYQSMVSDASKSSDDEYVKPATRFIRLLAVEKKEIFYIIFYGVIIGLIGLILPIGIQTTVELISGGVFFSSVYLLIGLVILGVVITGGLQIVQITLVEHLQRRIFTKAAFEFAFRIPRLKLEALSNAHAPELVNRFFDIMTLQKGLPKFLTDLSSAVIQIFFGLLLLSLYHPFFVFFSLILVTVLVVIFYLTGPRGLDSSISESKYKYKVVYWFEELARTMNSFKLAGNTDLPVSRTDYNVSNYLKYRKVHFSVLISQYTFIVLFKGFVTGGLLIVGTILVVDRQITLGQFVASEIIIILILAAVEKVIIYMEVVYDLLTAVDKIGSVTDLPLDRMGGVDLPVSANEKGYSVSVENLHYKYYGANRLTLKGINLTINSGERICISGDEGSGKTTLTKIIAGLHQNFEGGVSINGYSIRDLDLLNLKNRIAKNISQDDIFDGTIIDNVILGKQDRTPHDAIRAIEKAGLSSYVNQLPEGINTHIVSGGKGFSNTVLHRLILARCIAKQPRLLILNDFFSGLRKSEKLDLINRITLEENNWTFIAESNDPLIMAACDRVIVLHEGEVVAEGKYEELVNKEEARKYFQ